MLYSYEFNDFLLEMNKTLTITILLILLFRFIIRKSPKKYSYYLWIVVLFRMLCPISIKSNFSIYNLEKVLTPTISNPKVNEIITILQPEYFKESIDLNQIMQYGEIPGSTFYLENFEFMFLWATGIILLLLYSISTYYLVTQDSKTAIRLKDNIYQSEYFKTPFVVGYIKPKIIIPFNLDEESQKIIIEHEKVHIRRKDYIIRILFYIGCIIYCVNPFVWIAYHLFIKDMEMSCDEEVLLKYNENNKTYSQILFDVATEKQYKMPRPLAFGEKSVKQRIINILKWKKPNKNKMIFGISICLCCLFSFTTNPTKQKTLSELLNEYNINNLTEMSFVEIETINDEVFFDTDYKLEIDSWLHLVNLQTVMENIQISKSSIKPSNDSIASIYKIRNNDDEIIIKFNESYNECIIEKDNEIKLYRIKNPTFAAYRLVGGLYERLEYYGYDMYDSTNKSIDINTNLQIIEKYTMPHFVGKDNLAFISVNIIDNYYNFKCNYVMDKDTITLISLEDENIVAFDIVNQNNEYQLVFNESKSHIIYKEMLDKLKTIVFKEKIW